MLLWPGPAWGRDLAALSLLLGLNGLAWLPWFTQRRAPLSPLETFTLASGLSLAQTIIITLLAVYWPGPLTAAGLLGFINGLTVCGLLLNYGWTRHDTPAPPVALPTAKILIPYLLLLGLALGYRFYQLGYAEWHEDEAEALMLGVRLLQGEDYAIFLHRKGPAQMLLPVAVWLLSDHLHEGLARFPFAWSSFLSVITVYLLGRQGFGRGAGFMAALLWAINGYALAFGRMVQYQALIFFLAPLALYALQRAPQFPRFLYLAAMLLATSLLAHFDALLLLPAAAYLLITFLPQPRPYPLLLKAGLLFMGLVAAFYLPYIADPEFSHTTTYLAESRIKPGVLYNNLALLQRLDALYSSRFYGLLWVGGLLVMWGQTLYQAKRPWQLLQGVSFGACLTTLIWPALWRWGGVQGAIIPWLVLGGLWFRSIPQRSRRGALIMAGAAFGGYVFLIDDPRTHLYIMYPGLVILAGAGWAAAIKRAKPSAFIAITLSGLVVIYTRLIFLSPESSLQQTHLTWPGSWGEVVYGKLPKPRDYFGYPKQEGWKAIGALRAQGQFLGDFRSVNEDFVIPIWYNFGQARACDDTPAQLFVRGASPSPADYHLTGQIQREHETRLYLYSQQPLATVMTFNLADWSNRFDAMATPQQFIRQNQPPQLLMADFGGQIRLRGYDLPQREVKSGQTLSLHLYWEALDAPLPTYRAFVHLTDGSTLWAQQDDDPICRLPTPIWRAGQHGLGQFQLALDPQTPPGRYPLIVGLYQADTLTRLPLTGGSVGKVGDDFLWLGDITVIE